MSNESEAQKVSEVARYKRGKQLTGKKLARHLKKKARRAQRAGRYGKQRPMVEVLPSIIVESPASIEPSPTEA